MVSPHQDGGAGAPCRHASGGLLAADAVGKNNVGGCDGDGDVCKEAGGARGDARTAAPRGARRPPQSGGAGAGGGIDPGRTGRRAVRHRHHAGAHAPSDGAPANPSPARRARRGAPTPVSALALAAAAHGGAAGRALAGAWPDPARDALACASQCADAVMAPAAA